jgi:hypothetical protein
MKIGVAVREAHAAERALTQLLDAAGERHADEHDVFHMTRTLGRWSRDHLEQLFAQAARLEVDLDGDAAAELPPPGDDPGVTLLRDVRELHLAASRASLAWTVLAQGAQAISDPELLAVVTARHPQTLRTLKWTVQKAKDAAPQVLAG